MAFRVLNQAPQYLLPNGQVNAGGKLYFYETDLTTPRDTWSNEALTVLNPNPVLMDAAGRTATDVWGDGEYGVVMTDADDVEIWTRNNVRPDVGAGNLIPTLVNGQFLSNDGSILQWQPIRQLPDPTGLNNYTLVSDGTDWLATLPADLPDIPADGIALVTGGFRVGNIMILTGSAIMPASGTHTSTSPVIFPTPFSGTPTFIGCTNMSGGITTNGGIGAISAQAASTTGFTINLDVNIDSVDPGWNINISATVKWVAIGPVAP